MNWYAFLADVLVGVHVAYVGFVALGLLVILLGIACRWGWVRNFYFRTLHLLAIAVVAVEAALHIPCPLTTWERQLRGAAGQETADISFMGRLFDNLLFWHLPESFFTALHIGFAALVLLTFVLARPRLPAWLWRPRAGTAGA